MIQGLFESGRSSFMVLFYRPEKVQFGFRYLWCKFIQIIFLEDMGGKH